MADNPAPAAELRAAARLMREQHGPEHVRHRFWQSLADWLEATATGYEKITSSLFGAAGAAFVAGFEDGDLDPAIAVARAYLGGAK